MGETLVRLEGSQEVIVDKLTKSGLYKTRSEVIRAGILELGAKYRIFRSLRELEGELAAKKMEKISTEIKEGKRKVFSEQEIRRKYGLK
ncbi:MAG TPA: hypothetical protein VFF09_00395 [archaeon]|nr:hypothetical protein [archaeon]